jgi:uncharacterized protein
MRAGHWQGEDWILAVRVQPRASRAKVVGMQADRLKIALTSPPVDGAANKALCQMIAKELRVAKGRVVLLRGERSREKLLSIQGVDRESVQAFCLKYALDDSDSYS